MGSSPAAADDTKSSSSPSPPASSGREHKGSFIDEAIGDMDSDAPSAQRGVAESDSTPNTESNKQASELPCSPQQPSTPSAPMLTSEPEKFDDGTSKSGNLDASEAKMADTTISNAEQGGQFNEDRPDSVPEMVASADDAAMLSSQDDASTHKDQTILSETPQDSMDDEISLLHVIDSPSRYYPSIPSPTANDEDIYTDLPPLEPSPTKKPASQKKKRPAKEDNGPAPPAQEGTKPMQPTSIPKSPPPNTPHYPSIPEPTADDENIYTDLPPLDPVPERQSTTQINENDTKENDDPALPAREDPQTEQSSTDPKTAPPPEEDPQTEQSRIEPKTAPTITLSEASPSTTPRKAEASIREAPAQSSKPNTNSPTAQQARWPVQHRPSRDTQLDIPLPQPVKRKPKYSYELYFFPKVRLVFLDTHRRYEARQAFPTRWGSF